MAQIRVREVSERVREVSERVRKNQIAIISLATIEVIHIIISCLL